jgi:dipeptidyl aminopeptidase/acylaminoacyl peptidase
MGGEIDWNVPILGGEQMFQALKRLGRTTELVVYPSEYHEFKTPSHIKDRLERYRLVRVITSKAPCLTKTSWPAKKTD